MIKSGENTHGREHYTTTEDKGADQAITTAQAKSKKLIFSQ
ncbi:MULTISPECIES: hypothetical protein [Tetragenococcus]|nr:MULTISPECIES: hypothetical protein [Tetragenococcus]